MHGSNSEEVELLHKGLLKKNVIVFWNDALFLAKKSSLQPFPFAQLCRTLAKTIKTKGREPNKEQLSPTSQSKMAAPMNASNLENTLCKYVRVLFANFRSQLVAPWPRG